MSGFLKFPGYGKRQRKINEQVSRDTSLWSAGKRNLSRHVCIIGTGMALWFPSQQSYMSGSLMLIKWLKTGSFRYWLYISLYLFGLWNYFAILNHSQEYIFYPMFVSFFVKLFYVCLHSNKKIYTWNHLVHKGKGCVCK